MTDVLTPRCAGTATCPPPMTDVRHGTKLSGRCTAANACTTSDRQVLDRLVHFFTRFRSVEFRGRFACIMWSSGVRDREAGAAFLSGACRPLSGCLAPAGVHCGESNGVPINHLAASFVCVLGGYLQFISSSELWSPPSGTWSSTVKPTGSLTRGPSCLEQLHTPELVPATVQPMVEPRLCKEELAFGQPATNERKTKAMDDLQPCVSANYEHATQDMAGPSHAKIMRLSPGAGPHGAS